MKREIKFRGKDDQGEWQEGHLLVQLGLHYILTPIWEMYQNEYVETDRSTKHRVNGYTVGQFTGLFDKNGIEIYEGDVVRVGIVPFNYIGKNPEPYYVDAVCVYSPGSFLYKRISPFDKKKLSRNWTYKPVYRHDIYTVEIIGNIHDNPE